MPLNQGVEQLFMDWLFRALCTANFWPHRSDNSETLNGQMAVQENVPGVVLNGDQYLVWSIYHEMLTLWVGLFKSSTLYGCTWTILPHHLAWCTLRVWRQCPGTSACRQCPSTWWKHRKDFGKIERYQDTPTRELFIYFWVCIVIRRQHNYILSLPYYLMWQIWTG